METKFDNYIKELQSEPTIWPACYLEQQKNYYRNLPNDKNSTVLEFGPGRGYFTDWLICNGFNNITLVELDAENYTFLQKKYSAIKSINVIHDEMLSYLKKTFHTYDLIVSKMVLEHVPIEELSSVFSEGRRSLNKGGLMLHETINATNIIYGFYYRYDDFSHTTSFTSKSLSQLAQSKVFVRSHSHPGVFSLIKANIFGFEKKQISSLIKRLSLDVSSCGKSTARSFSSRLLSLISSFVWYVILNLRSHVSYFLTYLFYKEPNKKDVFGKILIVELYK